MNIEFQKLGNAVALLCLALEGLGAKDVRRNLRIELEPDAWYPIERDLHAAAFEHSVFCTRQENKFLVAGVEVAPSGRTVEADFAKKLLQNADVFESPFVTKAVLALPPNQFDILRRNGMISPRKKNS